MNKVLSNSFTALLLHKFDNAYYQKVSGSLRAYQTYFFAEFTNLLSVDALILVFRVPRSERGQEFCFERRRTASTSLAARFKGNNAMQYTF